MQTPKEREAPKVGTSCFHLFLLRSYKYPRRSCEFQWLHGVTPGSVPFNNADPESVQMLVDYGCVEYVMGLPLPKRVGLLPLITEKKSEIPRQGRVRNSERKLPAIGAMTA